MKNMNKEKMNCRSICCILIAILLTFLFIPQTTFADEQKVIRVGYDSNSQFIKENDGHYYGYGVEYLEKMAEYTGWKYEYVRVDSWHDTFDMLRNGSIDLICTAHYTEQRAAEFLYSDMPISINVSRIHFYSSELRSQLSELIKKYDLEPADIELEITESLCSEDSGKIFDTLRELQSDGFRIAMDDFGSGYSSLNMLKEMPLDIIKLDLKFLDGEGDKSQIIMKSLIEMAHTMELDVVVEGVELLSQVEFLRQFEKCYLQGYYYSKPVPTEVFEEMLKTEDIKLS